MSLIKNAFVYFAKFPDIDTMRSNLAKQPFKPVPAQMFGMSSFIPNPITGELVTPIEGGYSFTYRRDEKILPTSVINSKLADEIARIEAERDCELDRQEKRDLKDQITLDMLRVALIKTVIVHGFWHQPTGQFILATSSTGMADNITGDLTKICEPTGSRRVDISDLKYRLTNRLNQHISNPASRPFSNFSLGSYVQLKGEDGNKATFETDGSREPEDGIVEATRSGCQVERIELASSDLSFRLTKDFAFKSIRYAEVEFGDEGQEEEDAAGYWRSQAFVELSGLTGAVSTLCDLFEYVPGKAKEDEKPEPQAAAA